MKRIPCLSFRQFITQEPVCLQLMNQVAYADTNVLRQLVIIKIACYHSMLAYNLLSECQNKAVQKF